MAVTIPAIIVPIASKEKTILRQLWPSEPYRSWNRDKNILKLISKFTPVYNQISNLFLFVFRIWYLKRFVRWKTPRATSSSTARSICGHIGVHCTGTGPRSLCNGFLGTPPRRLLLIIIIRACFHVYWRLQIKFNKKLINI